MARKVTDPADAQQDGAPDIQSEAAEPQKGTVFVKNQVNEPLLLSDGRTFRFPASRLATDDEYLIKELTRLAESGRHGIFIQ